MNAKTPRRQVKTKENIDHKFALPLSLLLPWRLGVLAFIFTLLPQQSIAAPKVVGYFAEWTDYRADQISADKLTHINYAFGVIKNGECALNNREAAEAKLAGLQKLKQTRPDLRTLVSIGGWTDSGPFSDMALMDESRAKFAKSCVGFLRKYDLDGVDIDWEFPGGGGFEKDKFRKEDTQNYAALLQEVRHLLDDAGQTDHKHYLLTIAGPAGGSHLRRIELAKIHPLLDFINVMTYDFAGSWSEKTNFNAPLFAPANDPAGPNNNGDAAMKAYLASGVPPDKIVLGVPFYARAWTGVADVNHGLYQPHGKKPAKARISGPEWTFRDVEENYLNHGPERFWSDEAKVPWLFDAKSGLMVSYDDPQSLRIKSEYVRDHHLGGIMIWELSEDDRQSSLLNAIQAGLHPREPVTRNAR